MKTILDFIISLKSAVKDLSEAEILIEELERRYAPEQWSSYVLQPLTMELLQDLRSGISGIFRWRISTLCTDAKFDKLHRSHAETIRKFDDLAWENGFKVTQSRECVSFVEMAKEIGIINVTTDRGVTLTPYGEEVARDVRRQVEEGSGGHIGSE